MVAVTLKRSDTAAVTGLQNQLETEFPKVSKELLPTDDDEVRWKLALLTQSRHDTYEDAYDDAYKDAYETHDDANEDAAIDLLPMLFTPFRSNFSNTFEHPLNGEADESSVIRLDRHIAHAARVAGAWQVMVMGDKLPTPKVVPPLPLAAILVIIAALALVNRVIAAAAIALPISHHWKLPDETAEAAESLKDLEDREIASAAVLVIITPLFIIIVIKGEAGEDVADADADAIA